MGLRLPNSVSVSIAQCLAEHIFNAGNARLTFADNHSERINLSANCQPIDAIWVIKLNGAQVKRFRVWLWVFVMPCCVQIQTVIAGSVLCCHVFRALIVRLAEFSEFTRAVVAIGNQVFSFVSCGDRQPACVVTVANIRHDSSRLFAAALGAEQSAVFSDQQAFISAGPCIWMLYD